MNKPNYTIQDIANDLGISKATVSRAINNTKGISPDLRSKVLKYIDEIGYKPSSLAKGLSTGHTNIVGLIFGDVRNPFYAEISFNIQKKLNENGFMVMVFNSEYDPKKELEFIDIAENLHFAGLVLVTAQDKALDERLKQINIPIVFVNRSPKGQRNDSVLSDNFHAGYIATLHLIELGHTEIGFIKGPENSSASRLRYEGYLQAIKNYEIPEEKSYIYESNLKFEDGEQIAAQVLKSDRRPTSFIIVNDITSFGFMDHIQKSGFSIPDLFSIVSTDNIALSSMAGIDLTTIDQHAEKMSQIAAQLMLKRLNGSTDTPERIMLQPELIVRKSTQQCK